MKYSIILILALSFSNVLTDVPQYINYQGKLTDPSGALIDDTLSITFTIYDSSTAGNVLWTETQPTVVVEYGIFNVLLGSVNLIPDTAFNGDIEAGLKELEVYLIQKNYRWEFLLLSWRKVLVEMPNGEEEDQKKANMRAVCGEMMYELAGFEANIRQGNIPLIQLTGLLNFIWRAPNLLEA